MAGIGLKSFKYAKLNSDGTYGPVKTLAGAIECKVSLDLSEAMLYADDVIKEQVSIFKSGTLTAGIDDDNDEIFAELLGKTVDEETALLRQMLATSRFTLVLGTLFRKWLTV